MRSLLLTLLAGIVGAALLHIVIVFTVPYFAPGDAWTRVRALEEAGRFYSVERIATASGQALAAHENAFVRTRVCRFALMSGPIRVHAEGRVPFWSLSIFDPRSNEIFSINDRTVDGAMPDIALATPAQMSRLRESLPEALANSVMVETPSRQGFVLLRTVIPDESWETAADAFLDTASCAPIA
jgi:uncharacterized membrane protein